MFQTLHQDVDPDDRELVSERQAVHATFSQSPFVDLSRIKPKERGIQTATDRPEDDSTEQERPWNDNVVVRVADDVPWIDLILEIAMTTALANLVQNTTISRGANVLGYFCFWALTWWAWASAVAFNVRFRQGDVLNRLAAILHLAVFASLSAFTTDFDITSGIVQTDSQLERLAERIRENLNVSTIHGVRSHQFGSDRISILNFRGISMTMALSRVLLLAQYLIVFVYALRYRPRRSFSIASLTQTSASILLHIFSLLISATLFFTAFGVIGHNPTRQDNIVKIVLWYTALLLEMIAHFIPPLFKLSGHVHYPPARLYSRASVLFIVVLGQELDKITGTFKLIVGPAGFDGTSVIILISTGIILVGQFTLFFGSPTLKTRATRGLIWFFGQFLYTMALIVLLSGTIDQLVYFNLSQTKADIANALVDVQVLQTKSYPIRISVEDVPNTDTSALSKSGIATSDLINRIYSLYQTNDTAVYDARAAQLAVEILGILFEQFDVYPKPDEPLFWELEQWYSTTDPIVTNSTQVYGIISQFLRSNLDSTRWFPAAAGMTFFLLGGLRLLRQNPRDKWEWANGLTLIIGAFIYIPLCIMDIGSWRQIETPDNRSIQHPFKLTSAIWRFAKSGWALPSFAILTVLVVLADATCRYLARRSLRQSSAGFADEKSREQLISRPISSNNDEVPFENDP